MTNSYDVAHGLSQVHPGPEEPVEVAQQDDTLARTGNTTRDQEMYAAGIRTGEENTKHNAAIRGGVPDGWKLVPIEPTNAMVIEGVNAGLAHKDEPYFIYAAMLNAAPAAPGVSTVQDERRPDACPRCDGSGHISVPSDNSPDAHDVEVCCDHCQGTGAAVDAAKYLAAALSGEKYRHMQIYGEFKNFHRSLCARFGYAHDDIHFRRDLVSLEEAIAAKVAAPAAGDAQAKFDIEAAAQKMAECMDYPWAHMPEQGRTHTREFAQAVIDAALAAQRKGDA